MATASETNNAAFDIQRSHNAVEFETVAKVAGQGTTTQIHHYQWLDTQPFHKVSYYRLRQLDYSGTETFSPVVVIASEQKVALYPVPTYNMLTIEAPLDNTRYRVLNMVGGVLMTGNVSATNNVVNVASLPAGLYQMEVTSGTRRVTHKFTKAD